MARRSNIKETLLSIKLFVLLFLLFVFISLAFSHGGSLVLGFALALPPLMGMSLGPRKGYLFIFYFMSVLFIIGQRTIYLGEHIRFVPSEIIIWSLALLCLVKPPPRFHWNRKFPTSIILMCIAIIPGIFQALFAGLDMAFAFANYKMLLMGVPAVFICRVILNNISQVRTLVLILSIEALFLSFLGISEYFNLGFVHLFSGFLEAGTLGTTEGFQRLSASFWGGPMLAGFLSMIFTFVLAEAFNATTLIRRVIIIISLWFVIVTIYLSGHRGLWVPFLFSVTCFFTLRGAKGIVLLALLLTVGIQFVPEIGKERIQTVHGEHQDSSAAKREHRALEAIELIKLNPLLGVGWGGSGLVHSDLIQMTADSGIGLLLAFLGVLMNTLKSLHKLMSKQFSQEVRFYACGLFSSVLCAYLILAVQAWFNLPEQYAPFWIIMGIAHQFPNIVFNEYFRQKPQTVTP